jgi:hypothetical protein
MVLQVVVASLRTEDSRCDGEWRRWRPVAATSPLRRGNFDHCRIKTRNLIRQ